LATLPSLLALRDLRQRVLHEFVGGVLDVEHLIRLLELDPLALLRGLRAATAPLYGEGPREWSVAQVVQTLGSTQTRRLFDTPVVAVAGTGPLRRLWLHSLATATAARHLAAQSGLLAPDTAYLLGLLHDLPSWFDWLGHHRDGAAPLQTAAEWLRHWRLPERCRLVLADPEGGLGSTCQSPEATLVGAAELIAELADFGHPTAPGTTAPLAMPSEATDLLLAREVRREVAAALQSVGLDLAAPVPEDDAATAALELHSPFQARRTGRVEEVLASVLHGARGESYRGILTALTAAGLRYGGYDRAVYVKWLPEQNRLVVRSKADSSPRRPMQLLATPTAGERAALQRARTEERPVRIEAETDAASPGLLALLGADEALAVLVNREFATPSFLLLDRSLSLQPVQLLADGPFAATLGMCGSLLLENLLLRRRRQRAEKFARTDSLTRVANRRVGLLALGHELARARRTGQPLSILLCDLDHFKLLNDRFGHLQGDQALRATAEVLRSTVRSTDTVCRYGGEEFLVVLPDTEAAEAAVLATRLFTAVADRGTAMALPLTISIGCTELLPGDTTESVLHRADQALYASKDTGRNRFAIDAEPQPGPAEPPSASPQHP
jgi:diguanylate cyclase (GGDEF)-like protein